MLTLASLRREYDPRSHAWSKFTVETPEALRVEFGGPAPGSPRSPAFTGLQPQQVWPESGLHGRSQLKEPLGEEPLGPRQDPALGGQVILKPWVATLSGLQATQCGLSLATQPQPQTIPEQTGVTVVPLYL